MSESAGDGITPRASETTRSFVRRVVYPVVVIAGHRRRDLVHRAPGGDSTSSIRRRLTAPARSTRTSCRTGWRWGRRKARSRRISSWRTLGGGEAWLTDFRGHPVVLNFWATWCQPCRQEMPQLVTAYDKYKANGPGDHRPEPAGRQGPDHAVRAGLRHRLPDPHRPRRRRRRTSTTCSGLPTTYFIDANGVIRSVFRGPLQDKQNDTNVQGAIGETDLEQGIAADHGDGRPARHRSNGGGG